jgi:metal-responsive CopG/Arc/MetJ family transcriptional regulator
MRTTIRIDEELLKEAKQVAAKSGRSLTAVIEDALRESLSRHKKSSQRSEPVRLMTVNGNGLQPGVDLDDSAALLDLMES